MNNWGKITASVPADKKAALVTGVGVHYVPPEGTKRADMSESFNPLPIRKIPSANRQNPNFTDLTGRTKGRLTVIGLSLKKKMWVARCSCGKYLLRRTASILGEQSNNGACAECTHIEKLRRGIDNHFTGW